MKLPRILAKTVCMIIDGHVPGEILYEFSVEQRSKTVEQTTTIKAIITTCKRCDALVIVKKLKEAQP